MKKLVDFIVLILIYFFVFYKKWKKNGKYTLLINTVMYVYLSFVLYFTLMPIVTSLISKINHHYQYKPMNLVPFIDVLNGRGDFVRQIGLNIIMTIPFGFLLPLVKKENDKLHKVIFYTFLLSLSIELIQPFIGARSSDITDIITNTIGGIIGYIIYLLFKPIIIKILNYIENRDRV